MSENKTIIQGLDPADNNYASSNSNPQNFYSRGSNQSAAKGTVVPGMGAGNAGPASAAQANPQASAKPAPSRTVRPGKPVVGFLYSVSRTPLGEFWPLQIGSNSIGQSTDSDIVLAEGTVSSKHAVLVVRQVRSGIIAAITDTQSTNGTLINGEPIGFSAEECHNGDIITIGNNYEMLLLLIDAGHLGLKVSSDFIATAAQEEQTEEDSDAPHFDNNSTRGFSPYGGGSAPVWSGNAPVGGTVGLDGSVSGGNHGGTVSL